MHHKRRNTEKRNISSKKRCLLRLYIADGTPPSLKAMDDVQRLIRENLKTICTLQVIDVLKHPQDAERDRILATPTLMRVSPEPTRKIIGDFMDSEKVLNELQLYAIKEYKRS